MSVRSVRVRASHVVVSMLLSVLIGCGGGSSSPTPAPTNLTYSTNPAVYTKGVAITNDVPSNTGGAVRSYSVSPALPAGLDLDTTTGVISGTPTAVAAQATYTVTASNSGGATTAELVITVNDAAPGTPAYSANPAVYTIGVAITSNVPTSTGGAVVSYSVSPELPAGLSLDTSTGVISGTPTAIAARATYTVTASNSSGDAFVNVVITVNDAAPANLIYSRNPAAYTKDTAIADNVPSSTGGAVVSYSVSPDLPAGLSLDTSTGVISGTPTAVAAQATYTVTASNSGGDATADLVIRVKQTIVAGTSGIIAAGYAHTCAVLDGGAQCWGSNTYGQLGDGSATDSHVPAQVQGLTSGVQAIAAGSYHACALVNGGVQCWGSNSYGQLGNDSTADSRVPVQVQGLTSGVQAIAAGGDHTCAVVSGAVRCWGWNLTGQLGDGSTTDSRVPVEVQGLTSGAQAIAAGADHTCAVVSGGARCWGWNSRGQLGDGSTTDSHVPVQVQGLTSGVEAIAAGPYHTCALASGGARCWGRYDYGQLGDDSAADSRVPVQVQGLTSGVQAVAVGFHHTCALENGGALCWGLNGNGQLGDGSSTRSYVPVQVQGLTSGALVLTAGAYHACALVNGRLQCWGWNGSGQLGNDSTTQSQVPVEVTGLSF